MREFIYGYEIEAVVQEQGNARLLLVQDGEALVALKTTTTNNHKDRAQFQVEIECLNSCSFGTSECLMYWTLIAKTVVLSQCSLASAVQQV